jgi:hypothetical protein
MIHVPVSQDSPEERGYKIKKLLDIHGISYSCSTSPITLNNEFSFLAMLSMSKTFRKDEETLVTKVKTVKRALFELVDDLSHNIPIDDRPQVRVDITNHLPFIMAADMEISKVVKDWENFNEEGSLSFDPWDRLSHVKLAIFPSFTGINPVKSADRYAGGRATYLRNIIRS